MAMQRAFIHFSRAWYSNTPRAGGWTDEVLFGLYEKNGGTDGEMAFRWYPCSGGYAVKLEAFNDAWHVLTNCGDVLSRLAQLPESGPSPVDICAILTACGFADFTETEPPARYNLPRGGNV